VERVEVIVKVGSEGCLCEWDGKRRMWKEVVSFILSLFSHSFYVSSFSFPECQLDQGNQDVVHGDWSRHSCKDGVLVKAKRKTTHSHAYMSCANSACIIRGEDK